MFTETICIRTGCKLILLMHAGNYKYSSGASAVRSVMKYTYNRSPALPTCHLRCMSNKLIFLV
jgi:hypothetical protein